MITKVISSDYLKLIKTINVTQNIEFISINLQSNINYDRILYNIYKI